MTYWEAHESLLRTVASEPDVETAFLTYRPGTTFRPGHLVVVAPGADDARLATLTQLTREALGDFGRHMPFECVAEWNENNGRTVWYQRAR